MIQHDLEMMPIPPEFKPNFLDRYKILLGDKLEEFLKYSSAFPQRAIRVNTLKISPQEIQKRLKEQWELEPVPWCDYAFWIRHKGGRRDVGNLPEHALGYFYVQEPASMVPPLVLDAQPGDIVLDMCAAPGSKTTQIVQHMNNQGLVIANEYSATRMAPLAMNIQRIGSPIVVCTRMDGNRVQGVTFDKILVDAPCSGVGTIGKSPRTATIWNPGMIRRLGQTQLRLLNHAYDILKDDGTIVYSTCTTEPEENEAVVTNFLNKHPDMKLVDIELNIKRSGPVNEFNGNTYHKDIHKCLRIWPQDNNTEGFFVAKLKRTHS